MSDRPKSQARLHARGECDRFQCIICAIEDDKARRNPTPSGHLGKIHSERYLRQRDREGGNR